MDGEAVGRGNQQASENASYGTDELTKDSLGHRVSQDRNH